MAQTVEQTRTRFEDIIKEINPDADVSPGSALNELVLKLSATLHNTISNDIDNIKLTNNIIDVLASQADSYSEVMDKIASNYNISRNQGRKSVGKLKVNVVNPRNYTIRAGTTFIQPNVNLTYTTTNDYEIRTSPNPANTNELPLYTVGTNYFFIVPVTANDVGTQYQLPSGTKFGLNTGSNISDFIVAEAYGNFTSGAARETDKELISRFKLGLANKSLMSSDSIKANLRDRDLNVLDISIVGADDLEMTRSKQNVFGISTLGMADVYVRTTMGPETFQITKTATKIANDLWTLTIDNTDVPGAYLISSILLSGEDKGGSFLITSQTLGYSLKNFNRVNVINNKEEARFTRYQTFVLQFEYADNALALGSTLAFEVKGLYQPNIGSIQDIFVNDASRIASADYLVKSALPCLVSLNLKLYKKFSTDVILVDKIKSDIFIYINTLPFGESVNVSKIVDICHNYNVKRVDLPIVLQGEILGNDGSVVSISDNDNLAIPEIPSKGISKKTTLFFINYITTAESGNDSIGIEVI